MRKGKKKNNLLFYLIFLIGFGILLYPHISNFYYRYEATHIVTDFDQAKSSLESAEIKQRLDLARAFNESLHNVLAEDPYSRSRHEAGRAEYARMLEIHERIGHVEIPKIEVDIPMYAGTSEEVLQKGIGHLEGTSLPVGGQNTHSVLTAHSGLPKARLFTDLHRLKLGDEFYIHNIGDVLAYEVDQILVVEPSDFSQLLVVPNQDYVTLLTCTPYMVNTHRLLVRGHRIPYVEEEHRKASDQAEKRILIRYLLYALGMLVAIGLIFVLTKRKRRKK
ncbi:TPA: class C sortase [Streptococcus suis]|uniref:class C sortase n=1 Tax=Streptococcus suis TaxID=1307 RepID=UPI0021192069|nr:class C sortase [Streptococcus suis]MCQ8261959.1 class C sortase [Streptococcus suis]HEM2750191.1 class C sortase [Streptococcus suis]HEM4990896.1 class C sortase [Streptococcus suis]HEM5163461.1 class C sortase [Streptococcus suis]HEM5207246.1 class C sortase [Streptococcus suis]